ncbi:MAG: ABC transporter permease subunit [Clostridiaceae bacterium]|nr:ABC transporter permease subunit [Clostridiaceae bacterium]
MDGKSRNLLFPRKVPASKTGCKRFLRFIWRDKFLWLLVLPGIVYYLIFIYAPMFGLVISFENYSPLRGLLGGPWVGFKWFEQFFSSPFFGRLMRNTILLNVFSLLWGFPAPIIFALMINEVRSRPYKKIAQTISYLPHFISTVVIVGILSNLLSPNDGLINLFIKAIGGESINFLGQPEWFRTIYIASGIWTDLGWSCIIYLAAIAGIDSSLYEAATVDGANKFKQIFHITIPGIMPTVIILLIMSLGGMFSVGYEKIILLYNTNTYETADVINTYVYRRGVVNAEYSFGTAAGLFQSVINFALVIIVNKISKKLSEVSLW